MSRTCRGGWRANQTSAEQPRLAPWDPNDQRTQEDTAHDKAAWTSRPGPCGREDSNLQLVSEPDPKFDAGPSRQSAHVRLLRVCAGESRIVTIVRLVRRVFVLASAAGVVRRSLEDWAGEAENVQVRRVDDPPGTHHGVRGLVHPQG